jgi:Zn finger protein HypA/HybF involved in hydrogenase expression
MIKEKNIFGEKIKFFCKDCNKIVEAKRVGRKYVFRCPICKTKNVAFGTEKSIKNFFHIEEESK